MRLMTGNVPSMRGETIRTTVCSLDMEQESIEDCTSTLCERMTNQRQFIYVRLADVEVESSNGMRGQVTLVHVVHS